MRAALANLPRFIATPETAKHRFFVFLDSSILPDNALVNIALDDAFYLGVLSSRIHVTWALAAGSRLGFGNDPRYNKTRCFETFPFPDPTDEQRERIRALGERLDAHRKRQQALHPRLTLTDLYNVLDLVRAGEPLEPRERDIHEAGLVAILRQLHDELDAAVADAYGWPAALPDDEILTRLVALNAARATEEATGHVRWLRPAYQAPSEVQASQPTLLPDLTPSPSSPSSPPSPPHPAAPQPWPDALPAQAAALRDLLATLDEPATVDEIAAAFAGRRSAAQRARLTELLDTLAALGQARQDGERWGG